MSDEPEDDSSRQRGGGAGDHLELGNQSQEWGSSDRGAGRNRMRAALARTWGSRSGRPDHPDGLEPTGKGLECSAKPLSP